MTSIEKILLKSGPILSGELVEKIQKSESIPLNTASQRVSRDRNILKIKGFFVSRQALCYLLPIHISENKVYEAFYNKLFEYGRKYWYCINAVKFHKGIINNKYLECYTNYPIKPLKSHLPFKKVMQNFVSENILIFNQDEYLFSPKIFKTEINSQFQNTIETIKDNVLSNFHSYSRNIGLISYNSGELFGEYGKFRWAFKGVSPIKGLKQNGDNGFLLADILLGTSIYKKDILFFIEKLKHIETFQNASRLIPVLIVDDLDKEAFDYLKYHGVVVGFIKELFGEKYAKTLKQLFSILNNAGANLKKEPNAYLNLIKELKKYNEGLLNNIRGTLFEFAVGHIHSVSGKSIEYNREIIGNNGRHEIDVRASDGNKIVIIECKATNEPIDSESINKWLKIKIPAFRKWIL